MGAPKNSELFRATPSHSELFRATPSHSELLRALQATPRHSEWLLELSELSQRIIRAIRAFRALLAATRVSKARKKLRSTPSYSEWGAPKNSELLRATQSTPSCSEQSWKLRATVLRAQSLPSPELQALLNPHNSTACGQQSPLLRGSEVKNSEWRAQIAPASAVCGELGLPSLERETGDQTGGSPESNRGISGIKPGDARNRAFTGAR